MYNNLYYQITAHAQFWLTAAMGGFGAVSGLRAIVSGPLYGADLPRLRAMLCRLDL